MQRDIENINTLAGAQSAPPHQHEPRLIALVDWAREFLATEVTGQYTSDAALHLALAVWVQERSATQRSTGSVLEVMP